MYINNADHNLSLNRSSSGRNQPNSDERSKRIAASTKQLEHNSQRTGHISNKSVVAKTSYFDRAAVLSTQSNDSSRSTDYVRGQLVDDKPQLHSRTAIEAYTSHDEIEQRQEYIQKLGIDVFA